jgi:RHS repeat-associated protein
LGFFCFFPSVFTVPAPAIISPQKIFNIKNFHYLSAMNRGYRYGFNGKENDNEIAGNGNSQDFGARMYDNRLGRWWSVDPMAHVAPSWSLYRAFYCNPIRYIDPTGMLEHDYGLDKQGNITLLRKTDDPTDKLIALDNDGNETDKSIEVDKGILSSKKTNTVTVSNGKDYTFDQYKIKGDDKAKGLFEFVADNTEVEWSLTGVGAKSGTDGQNILTTSHIKDSEIGGGYLKAYGYTIRKHSHSHPYNTFPSTADKEFAESLNLKFPKATLDIYHKGEYFQYDKNGLISVPTKVPKN